MTEQESEVKADPSAKRVIEGLRDTGYVLDTAISDIIDNSITAGAKNIDIMIGLDPNSLNSTDPYVYIVDDGTGMTHDELIAAMKYGSAATKSNDKLGKFGLGLKTASTAFCRDLSVVSRSKGNPAVKAEWDLDYIADKNEWLLKTPAPTKDDIDILDLTTKGNSGTLVKWGKVDRLLSRSYAKQAFAQKALNAIIESLSFHLSLTFQNFLDPTKTEFPNIVIRLNGKKIEAWDPFGYGIKNVERLSKQSNDDKMKVQMLDGSEAFFTIEGWVLPRKEEMTPEEVQKAKISNDLQGIYVYREGRLIHYGDYLGMMSNEPHGSLLRIKLSFDKNLDELFNVDIKKSRILLNADLYNWVEQKIVPWKREADNRYRKGQTVTQSKIASDVHQDAGRAIDSKATAIETAQVVVKDPKKDQVEVKNERGTFLKTITIEDPNNQFGRIIPVPQIDDGLLWRPAINDGKESVEINEGHPFYTKVYGPILKNSPIVQGIDYLFWALSEAENATYDPEAQKLYEDFRYEVSRKLRKLVEDLPDPEPADDNDKK